MFRAALISLFLTSTALATTWTVDDDGKADFDNIASALKAAGDGDQILISAGTYFESNLFIEDPNITIIGDVNSDGTPCVIINGSKSEKSIILGIGVAAATGG